MHIRFAFIMRCLVFTLAIVAGWAHTSIVQLAESNKDLSTLVSALVAADLVDTLSSSGPFTVFAPTNSAFNALPAGTLDNLMKPQNKAQLVDILTFHVLPERALAKDLALFQAVKTVEGKNLHVQKWGESVKVGASLESKDLKTVTNADNIASNGVVHIIDGVLIPAVETTTTTTTTKRASHTIVDLAESTKGLSTLVSALVAADLVDTLSSPGPFTVFAPTNAAFQALPAGTLDNLMKPENKAQLVDILTYHVLPVQALAKDLDLFQAVKTVEGKNLHVQKWGGSVKVGASLESKDLKSVTSADNVASNGVVHVIDGVLLPPAKLAQSVNIVKLAESTKDLSTLVSALVAADLVDTLSSPGPFTVFAPTNAAFKALPAGTLDDLMKPENKAHLVDILTYHVLPRQVLAKDLDLFQAVKTVEGKNLQVEKSDQSVKVGSLNSKDLKTVTSVDNIASNGVVHIIDGVLIPSTTTIIDLAESTKDLSTLVSALVAADLVDTLSSPGPFTVFAPTNDAFKALPAGTLDDLMKPENKAQLADILTYHVLPKQVLAKDLDLFQAVTTVEGKNLHVQKWGGSVKVGASLESKDLKSVTSADNTASNGVVHIIDGVLLPPASNILI